MKPSTAVSRIAHAFVRALRAVLGAIIALLLIFEEWGWEPLARCFAWLSRWRVWRQLEQLIRGLPPVAALLVFTLPMLLLLPVKLLALLLFGRGHPGWGLLLLIGAKAIGTALVARLFQLTQASLMQLAWFARLYPRWKAWKDALVARVRASPLWLQSHAWVHDFMQWWRRMR